MKRGYISEKDLVLDHETRKSEEHPDLDHDMGIHLLCFMYQIYITKWGYI